MSATTPEKCPKCGSEIFREETDDWGEKVISYARFICETTVYTESKELRLQGHFCILKERDQLVEKVKELEKKRSWRPIRTCPHNREWVLGYDEKDGETGMIIFDWHTDPECIWMEWTDGMRTWTPTHWMPLPEPPKEKGRQ